MAIYAVQTRLGLYTAVTWNILEYLLLFTIVLMHEFGHALACRQVGGQAKEIILWPLGGVAFVRPPQRPGAVLWSIAAGPLVNVVLVPVLYFALQWAAGADIPHTNPSLMKLFTQVWRMNLALLIFNMMPVYPLDGGQILRSVLWFWLGPIRSLLVATAIGFVGAVALAGFAIYERSYFFGLMVYFMFMQCQRSWMQARAAARIGKMQRRAGFKCPACGAAPVVGEIWKCEPCQQTFDLFVTRGVCPHCGAVHPTAQCVDCGAQSPIEKW